MCIYIYNSIVVYIYVEYIMLAVVAIRWFSDLPPSPTLIHSSSQVTQEEHLRKEAKQQGVLKLGSQIHGWKFEKTEQICVYYVYVNV